MTPRRASLSDAATLARLNAHVQGWHAAQYPDVFHATPDHEGLVAHFADRLADPACTAFLAGDPPLGYALCTLQTRDASVFSPAIRRLMVDHIADARKLGVEVLAPDINRSETEFSVTDGKIVFGLAAIKGCGRNATDAACTEYAGARLTLRSNSSGSSSRNSDGRQ